MIHSETFFNRHFQITDGILGMVNSTHSISLLNSEQSLSREYQVFRGFTVFESNK